MRGRRSLTLSMICSTSIRLVAAEQEISTDHSGDADTPAVAGPVCRRMRSLRQLSWQAYRLHLAHAAPYTRGSEPRRACNALLNPTRDCTTATQTQSSDGADQGVPRASPQWVGRDDVDLRAMSR